MKQCMKIGRDECLLIGSSEGPTCLVKEDLQTLARVKVAVGCRMALCGRSPSHSLRASGRYVLVLAKQTARMKRSNQPAMYAGLLTC